MRSSKFTLSVKDWNDQPDVRIRDIPSRRRPADRFGDFALCVRLDPKTLKSTPVPDRLRQRIGEFEGKSQSDLDS